MVTIITPSYNHAQYIERAVESVMNQTYKNIEYIIIDDGSKDNSHEVLKKIQLKYPSIKILLNNENKGHERLNEGVNISNGELISILASDDWYLPQKIEKQVQLFNTLPSDYGVVYSGGYRYFEDTKETKELNFKMEKGDILKSLLTKPFFIYPITPLIKKECLLRYPFSPGFSAEGEAIYFKIAQKYKFDYIDEPLVIMRDHSYNTGKDIYAMARDVIMIREELFNHPDFPPRLQYIKPKLFSKVYLQFGWDFVRLKKNYSKGREFLIKAFKSSNQIVFKARWLIGIIITLLPSSMSNLINKKSDSVN